jgi:hypothetical protein
LFEVDQRRVKQHYLDVSKISLVVLFVGHWTQSMFAGLDRSIDVDVDVLSSARITDLTSVDGGTFLFVVI